MNDHMRASEHLTFINLQPKVMTVIVSQRHCFKIRRAFVVRKCQPFLWCKVVSIKAGGVTFYILSGSLGEAVSRGRNECGAACRGDLHYFVLEVHLMK